MLQSADLVHADELPVEGTTTGDIDLEHFSGFFEKLYGDPLDKALDKDGLSLGRLLNNLGLAREVTGDLPGALQAQQTAYSLSFQPRLTQYQQTFSRIASLTNLARMLAQHDQEAAAERLLVQVVEAVPMFPHAAWNLAVLYAKTGRCQEGRIFAARARRLDKSFQELICE